MKEIILNFLPDNKNITKHFKYFTLLDDATKQKLVEWVNIPESDFEFLSEIFQHRKLKVKLDDIVFIYNYFKFIKRVTKTDFNRINTELEKGAAELWPFLSIIYSPIEITRISFKHTGTGLKHVPETVTIKSGFALETFRKLFDEAILKYPQWTITRDYLLGLKNNKQLGYILKPRSGNKVDYLKSVLRQSVTQFKEYLSENCKTSSEKPVPIYTIIGEILEEVGLIKGWDGIKYNDRTEYFNKTIKELEINHAYKKLLHARSELFPPHYFMYINNHLI